MQPQFTAWQAAPHARVACVECHIGEGATALRARQAAGVRQLYHVADRSVPEADSRRRRHAAGARDVRDVPLVGHGDSAIVIRVIRRVRRRRGRTPRRRRSCRCISAARAADAERPRDPLARRSRVRIEYVATDARRQTIPYVKVTDAQGSVKEYATEGTTPSSSPKGTRARWTASTATTSSGIAIAPTPEQAVDDGDRRRPHQPRAAVRAARRRPAAEGDHPSQDEGCGRDRRGSATVLCVARQRHRRRAASPRPSTALQTIVIGRNVFPDDEGHVGHLSRQLGHMTSSGCFRCHDGSTRRRTAPRSARLRVLPQADRTTLNTPARPRRLSATTPVAPRSDGGVAARSTRPEGLRGSRPGSNQGINGDANPVGGHRERQPTDTQLTRNSTRRSQPCREIWTRSRLRRRARRR